MPSILAAAGLALILAGCAQGSGSTPTLNPGSTPGTSAAATASGGLLTVNVGSDSLGSFLVGDSGKSLYLLTKDPMGSSSCTGNCATTWPPLTLTAGQSAVAGSGVSGTIGTIARPDGSTQVAIDGHPLYYFSGDSAAGDTNGQGVNGTWFLVTPAGAALGASPSTEPSNGGGYNY